MSRRHVVHRHEFRACRFKRDTITYRVRAWCRSARRYLTPRGIGIDFGEWP